MRKTCLFQHILQGLCFLFVCILGMYSPVLATQETQKQSESLTLTYSYAQGISAKDAVHIVKSLVFFQALRIEHAQLAEQRALSFGAQSLQKQLAVVASAYATDFQIHTQKSEKIKASERPSVKQYRGKTTVQPQWQDGTVEVTVQLSAKEHKLERAVQELLAQKSLIEMRVEWIELLQENTVRGADLLLMASGIRVNTFGGSWALLREEAHSVARRLAALWLYDTALKNFREIWQQPQEVEGFIQEALRFDNSLPALWTCLGEVQLQLDHPNTAISSLHKALQLQPERARALYIRALAYLRLQQPSLAEVDLNEALLLRPYTPTWLHARGAAYMMLEEYPAMCADFEEACALGQCEGLQNARKQDLCQYGTIQN